MNDNLKEYFNNMFKDVNPNIMLDEEQINSILNDDNYVLVLAGAGTGKTTTMVAKVKYLVDIKHVDPTKILVISYTKKAVQELQELINDKFGINAEVTTFHSLAYKYVRNIFRTKKCSIVDYNEKEQIFYEYIDSLFKQKRIYDLIGTFNEKTLQDKYFFYGHFFINNHFKYNDYSSFFEDYKKYKLQEAKKIGLKKAINYWIDKRLNNDEFIITIKGEFVKSAGEAIIANFLYTHGIEYSYEQIYSEIVENRKIYKPDFTMDLAGEKVYLEYFGMNNSKYNQVKYKKIQMHKQHHNKFIYIDYENQKEIERELDDKLKKMGFVYQNRTDEEIYNRILDNNKLSSIYKLKKLFYKSILQIKESINRKEYKTIVQNYIQSRPEIERKNLIKQFQYINDFYIFYSKKLYNSDVYGFDYSDLIYYSNLYMSNKEYLKNCNYDYIIIDEYQDISDGEYSLVRKTSNRGNSKVFAVGDDWQSIYSFRGSNIRYITKFSNYFTPPTVLTINKAYRNSQELVDISGDFIKKNKSQIDKSLISNKYLTKPIIYVPFDDRVGFKKLDDTAEYKKLKELVLKIHEVEPTHKILILARTNNAIEKCFEYDSEFEDALGTKIRIASIRDADIEGMTIHKAKGLTYDEVIIIGMNSSFPSDQYYKYWLEDLFKPKVLEEDIEFPEERRLLYVALTRTKNNVFILTNKNIANRSRFIDELIEIEKEVTNPNEQKELLS